ncbi:hypothetical protein [Pseudomonas sp. C9-3]|uniref:hypothetical protein n=1 Tax=Pseudomonas sp. C9-3 TaxID=3078264 RepID=UPI0028EDFF59|nr:hypothetical protein [Pseudomonas sp. C9-3]
MLLVYESGRAYFDEVPDFIHQLCTENEIDLDEALRIKGFSRHQQYGNHLAGLEVYEGSGDAEYAALVLAGFGAGIQGYVMPTLHDLLNFMKEYAPTIKALAEMDPYGY